MRRILTVLLGTLFTTVGLSGCIADGDWESMGAHWEDEWDEWQTEWDAHAEASVGHDHDHHDHGGGYDDTYSDAYCDEHGWDHEEGDGGDTSVSEDHRHESIGSAYEDADERHTNVVDGHDDSKKAFAVSAWTDALEVRLVYDLHGEVEIRLRDPTGLTVARERFDGQKAVEEDPWYVVEDPLPGKWTATVEIDGHGAYTIGFYAEE